MVLLSQSTKIVIVVSLFSLLVWVIYWLIPSFSHFFNLILGVPDQYTGREWYFMPSHFGLIARFFAAALGLSVCLIVWVRKKHFASSKRLVVLVLVLESAYWLSLLPSFFSLVTRMPAMTTLGVAYLIQIVLAAPFLLILSFKVYWSHEHVKSDIWRWVGFAFLGYVGVLWVNAIMRWLDMVSSEGFAFSASGFRVLGFFDAAIFMSLAVSFALAGAYSLSKQNRCLARKWVGLALAMAGFHYIIYVTYSVIAGALSYIFLVDVWTLPFLGLGISLIFTDNRFK